jgi:hypothetical protein
MKNLDASRALALLGLMDCVWTHRSHSRIISGFASCCFIQHARLNCELPIREDGNVRANDYKNCFFLRGKMTSNSAPATGRSCCEIGPGFLWLFIRAARRLTPIVRTAVPPASRQGREPLPGAPKCAPAPACPQRSLARVHSPACLLARQPARSSRRSRLLASRTSLRSAPRWAARMKRVHDPARTP